MQPLPHAHQFTPCICVCHTLTLLSVAYPSPLPECDRITPLLWFGILWLHSGLMPTKEVGNAGQGRGGCLSKKSTITKPLLCVLTERKAVLPALNLFLSFPFGRLPMIQEHLPEIEEIIGQMQCSKDFECYKSGFENLCKAEDVGMVSNLRCLEEDHRNCLFLLTTPHTNYCHCPLRVYIAKVLKK